MTVRNIKTIYRKFLKCIRLLSIVLHRYKLQASIFHACILALFFLWRYNYSQTSKYFDVCIIGNTDSKQKANKIYDMWGNAYSVTMYLFSNLDDTIEYGKNNYVVLVSDKENLSFKHGIERAFNTAKRFYHCNYYFIHDDDLIFEFNEATQHVRKEKFLSKELSSVLAEYKPYFAGFLWEKGLSNKGLYETNQIFQFDRVQPFVCGDSGMTLYHRSVVSFFIPLSPNGQNGFVGNWTLPTHFIDLFASSVNHSLVINTIKYINSINPDNVDSKNGKWMISGDGTATNTVSRHKYEWPQNENFLQYLYGSALDLETTRARQKVKGLKYKVFPRILYPGELSFLESITSIFDPRHPLLRSNPFLNSKFAARYVQFKVNTRKIELLTTIVAYKRFENAEKLLLALSNQKKVYLKNGNDKNVILRIRIHIDYSNEKEIIEKFIARCKVIEPGVEIIKASHHKGILKTWLSLWSPKHMDSFHIVLEDDLIISNNLLESSVKLIRDVYYSDTFEFNRIFSISLYNEITSHTATSIQPEVEELIKSDQTLRKLPMSWGAIFASVSWNEFLTWVHGKANTDYNPFLQDSLSNRWPKESSWKKYCLRFMAENNLYTYFPKFPENSSLTLKSNLPGEHENGIFEDSYKSFRTLEGVTLRAENYLQSKKLSHILKYDTDSTDYQGFDGCTLVMPVCFRKDFLIEALEHYTKLNIEIQIIVVVQPCEDRKNTLLFPKSVRGVKILYKIMNKNDLNNRYLDFPEIKYHCVINIDDDVLHPIESMETGIRFWREHFFDFYVGWTPQARIHVWENGKVVYKNQSWVNRLGGLSSMLLPSGSVFHRKYLKAYNAPENILGRNVVSKTNNCDDILMNFVISNISKAGPVVINDWSSLKRSESLAAASNNADNAQWKKEDHMDVRSDCIQRFFDIYSAETLQYSSVEYKFDRRVKHGPISLTRSKQKYLTTYLFYKLIPNRNTLSFLKNPCDAHISNDINHFLCKYTQ